MANTSGHPLQGPGLSARGTARHCGLPEWAEASPAGREESLSSLSHWEVFLMSRAFLLFENRGELEVCLFLSLVLYVAYYLKTHKNH